MKKREFKIENRPDKEADCPFVSWMELFSQHAVYVAKNSRHQTRRQFLNPFNVPQPVLDIKQALDSARQAFEAELRSEGHKGHRTTRSTACSPRGLKVSAGTSPKTTSPSGMVTIKF